MSEVVQCQQWSAFQTLEFRPKIHVRVATGTWPWLLVISGDFYGIIHSNSINGVSSVLITGKRATTAGTRVFFGIRDVCFEATCGLCFFQDMWQE